MKYSFIQNSEAPNLWSNRISYSGTVSFKTITKIDFTSLMRVLMLLHTFVRYSSG